MYLGKGVEDAKDSEEPQHDANHDHRIENGFDAALHGDKAIHNPEQDAYEDERDHNVEKRHNFLISCDLPGDRKRKPMCGAETVL